MPLAGGPGTIPNLVVASFYVPLPGLKEMTEDPTKSPKKTGENDKATLEDKKNISLILLVAAWFIPFLWPFAIAGTIGMFPQTSKKIGFGLLALIGFGVVAVTVNGLQQSAQKPSDAPADSASEGKTQVSPSPAVKTQESTSTSAASESSSSRRYLGTSPTGYELWADNDCVYVKGITEGDLARLGTDVWGFKKAVKAETGYSCVLYE